MSPTRPLASDKSRLAVLLEHFSTIEDPRDVRRILDPLSGVLLLAVCPTIADCDDYDHTAAWGEAHLDFLRRHAPFAHRVPHPALMLRNERLEGRPLLITQPELVPHCSAPSRQRA